ncbi:hypothetical protein M899_2542 [Bacteriovorax sp. BSW11_IV]|uniref:hypothetical protein n=1 Tax=Bacteriovorax sp. BSW11_IV TaxID=1353529 RepID=UPI00038A1BBF|nr:hypothetical protein [Bacteriovorax sp. BSW11_IV]EQC50319.1 hypothetical protein M899_2542 [Bacteriovorax sp. BSW11_IV]
MILKTIKEFPITSLTVVATLVLPFLLRPEVPEVAQVDKKESIEKDYKDYDTEKYWDDNTSKKPVVANQANRAPSSVNESPTRSNDNIQDLASEQSEAYEPENVSSIGSSFSPSSSSSSGSSYSSPSSSASSFSSDSSAPSLGDSGSSSNSSSPSNEGSFAAGDSEAVSGCGQNCGQTVSSTTTTESDSSSSSSGDSSTSSSGGNIPSPSEALDPSFYADKASGTYSQIPTITLSGQDVAGIYYCIGNGSCCDPTSGGQLYSSSFPISSGDGNYCLSIAGQSANGSFLDKIDYTYTVDSQVPDLTVTPNVRYLQTTEALSINVTSTDFGESDHYMRFYNLPSDPTGSTCSEISENNDHATVGLDIDNDGNADQYDLASLSGAYVLSDVKRELSYGPNYIVSLIENTVYEDSHLYSCSTDIIVLSDFDYLMDFNSSTGSVPVNGNGHMEFQGHFNSYGHFGAGASGSGVDTSNVTAYLESGALNILN